VEIEVFSRKGNAREAKLREKCEFYQKLLGIRAQELVANSYSDQLLKIAQSSTCNVQRKNRTLRLARSTVLS
jgi:hypothetical protein